MNDTSYPPTSAEINALPPNLRRWIHELETDADPAGTIRQAALVEDENRQLRAKVAELQVALDDWEGPDK
jgi:hypothetical protein